MKSKLLTTALLCTAANVYAGCGSSFCTIDTHWNSQGMANEKGLFIDLRYSYAKADTPRIGTSKVNNDPALAAPGDEVENLHTINQILNLDLGYAVNQQWNFAVGIPVIMRDHSHTIAPTTVEQGKFSELGDIRVIGNYNFTSEEHHSGSGMRFGLKLPTGSTTWEFQPGAVGERNIQPGSGSTDAILGVYAHRTLMDTTWGLFASALLQSAVSTKDDYRPGNSVKLDAGADYAISQTISGLLQLNAQFLERDSGLNSNPHTGGKSLNLSPGLSFQSAETTRLYGFVQFPLYQYANADPAGSPDGQLTAPWSVSIGVSQSF